MGTAFARVGQVGDVVDGRDASRPYSSPSSFSKNELRGESTGRRTLKTVARTSVIIPRTKTTRWLPGNTGMTITPKSTAMIMIPITIMVMVFFSSAFPGRDWISLNSICFSLGLVAANGCSPVSEGTNCSEKEYHKKAVLSTEKCVISADLLGNTVDRRRFLC